jgi:hypothetical protein
MVAHAEVLVAPRACGFSHLIQRVAAIGLDRMRMQNAPDVFLRYKPRQLPCARQGNLSAPFAQFRFNVLQPERLVDFALRLRCNDLARPLQTIGRQFVTLLLR